MLGRQEDAGMTPRGPRADAEVPRGRSDPVLDLGLADARPNGLSGNENAHPKVSILRIPCSSQGDVHGRIRFDGFATAKTYVIGY